LEAAPEVLVFLHAQKSQSTSESKSKVRFFPVILRKYKAQQLAVNESMNSGLLVLFNDTPLLLTILLEFH
jgi:hypothetical protein